MYPETTVIFADIVGFTAWSSSRDPIQVFHLLETIYAGFDEIARKHGVFKIETIGDCYVAVVGLPKRRNNHAVVMVHFAKAICLKMIELTHKLENSLGPVSEVDLQRVHFFLLCVLSTHSIFSALFACFSKGNQNLVTSCRIKLRSHYCRCVTG